jgi:hypothetical protein
MHIRGAVITALILAGLVAGPWALKSASATAHQWSDIPFILIGSVICVLFILGIQVFFRKYYVARSMWQVFGAVSLFISASGFSAMTASIMVGTIAPSTFIFLAFGLGIVCGLSLARVVYRRAFVP